MLKPIYKPDLNKNNKPTIFNNGGGGFLLCNGNGVDATSAVASSLRNNFAINSLLAIHVGENSLGDDFLSFSSDDNELSSEQGYII